MCFNYLCILVGYVKIATNGIRTWVQAQIITHKNMARKGSSFMVKLFNCHNDFTLWQQRMKSILTREGTVKALKRASEKLEAMKVEE